MISLCCPHFSLDKHDNCRNRLLQVRLSKRKLELFWFHTRLTSFRKMFDSKETNFRYLFFTKHIQCIKYKHMENLERNTVLYTESGTFSSRVPNGRLLSNLDGSVGRSDSGVVVVVGAEFSLSSSSSNTFGLAPVDPTWRSSKMDGANGVSFPGR